METDDLLAEIVKMLPEMAGKLTVLMATKGIAELREMGLTLDDASPEMSIDMLQHSTGRTIRFTLGIDLLDEEPAADTHGSPELDEDAEKLRALGADPGPTLKDLDDPA